MGSYTRINLDEIYCAYGHSDVAKTVNERFAKKYKLLSEVSITV